MAQEATFPSIQQRPKQGFGGITEIGDVPLPLKHCIHTLNMQENALLLKRNLKHMTLLETCDFLNPCFIFLLRREILVNTTTALLLLPKRAPMKANTSRALSRHQAQVFYI